MVVVYLSCLIAGGAFVLLSAFGGGDHGDADADAHVDGHGDLDGDLDADAHVELDGDLDADVHVDAHDVHLDAHGGHLEGGASDAVHGVREGRARRRRRFLPFLSLRFWFYGTAFFGLTGALLTWLSGAGEPVTALVSAATGLVVGTAMAGVTHLLADPVNADAVSPRDYAGASGELVGALRPGGVSRVRIQVRHRQVELLARTADPLELPAGTRVAILSLDADGHAVVAPEDALFHRSD